MSVPSGFKETRKNRVLARGLKPQRSCRDSSGPSSLAILIEYSSTNLQEMMSATFGPAHLLLFHKPPAHDLVGGRLRKSRRDRLVVAPAIAVVRDERSVRVDVAAELTQHAQELRLAFGSVRYRHNFAGELVNNLQGASNIPVPEIPLQTDNVRDQLGPGRRFFVSVALSLSVRQSERELAHQREAHRNVEPIQDVLCLRTHAHLEIADGVTAVRQKDDVLIHLKALRREQLMESPLGLGIEAADKAEALGISPDLLRVIDGGAPALVAEAKAAGRDLVVVSVIGTQPDATETPQEAIERFGASVHHVVMKNGFFGAIDDFVIYDGIFGLGDDGKGRKYGRTAELVLEVGGDVVYLLKLNPITDALLGVENLTFVQGIEALDLLGRWHTANVRSWLASAEGALTGSWLCPKGEVPIGASSSKSGRRAAVAVAS